MKKFLLGMFVVAMLAVSAPVQANLLDYDSVLYLTSDHMTGGAGTPPFGYVGLRQNGSDVNFHVELYDGSKFVRTGAGSDYNFLFNATGVTLSDISGTGLTAGSGTIHADGTGYWQFGVYFTNQGTNGGSDALSGPIDFTVENALISEVTVGNGANIFAADILSGQTQNTGMVDAHSASVPEPMSILLLGVGLIGLAGYGKRKFSL